MMLKRVLLAVIALVVIYYNSSFSLAVLLPLVAGVFAGYFIKKEYLFFGGLMAVNFYLIGVLVFIYGLPAGTLYNLKKKKENIIWDGVFFALGAFVFYFFSVNILPLFSAGALITLSLFMGKGR